MRRSPADSTNRSLAAFGKLQHIHVDRRVGQIDVTRADPVAGLVEHVAVALLNGDREFLLGPGLHLAHLGPLAAEGGGLW